MNRLFTSLALLVATLVPAQAGLLDWGNGQPTILTGAGDGSSTVSALFAYSQLSNNSGLSTLAQGDIVCGIFDFGTVNAGQANQRDIFGLMKAEVYSNNGTGNVIFQTVGGSDSLYDSLVASGFDPDALTTLDGGISATFALFSTTQSLDLATVATGNASDATLGIDTARFELDLMAGDGDTGFGGPDELRFTYSTPTPGNPSNAPSSSDTGLAEFVLALSGSKSNGSAAFQDTSYTAGSLSGSTDIVVSGSLASIDGTAAAGYTYQIGSGPTLQFTAVPEPSSLAILGLVGVAGTAMRRRRK